MSYRMSIFKCTNSKVKKRCHDILKQSIFVFTTLETRLFVLLHLEESFSLKEK